MLTPSADMYDAVQDGTEVLDTELFEHADLIVEQPASRRRLGCGLSVH